MSVKQLRHQPAKLVSGLLAAVSLVALSGCASRSAAPFEQGESRYRFEFRLERVAGETGSCAASVRVRDLTAKHDLAVPLFTAPWGAATERTAVDSAYGAALLVRVEVRADGVSGAFRAELRRDDLLLATRSAAIPVKVVKPAPGRTYR